MYEYVEHPENDGHRVKRTKPAPRPTSELSTRRNRNVLVGHSAGNSTCSPTPWISGDMNGVSHSIPQEALSSGTLPNHSPVVLHGTTSSFPLLSSFPNPSPPPSSLCSFNSLYASNELIRPATDVLRTRDGISITSGPIPDELVRSDSNDSDDDCSLEITRAILRTTPTPDKNAKENTLPFALYCYFQYTVVTFFEPLRVIDSVRNQVSRQFSSKESRKRTVLIANVMIMFARNLAVNNTGVSILNYLAVEAGKLGSSFMATPPSSPALDKRDAMHTLDNMLEVFALQVNTQPSAPCLQLLDTTASVFRRACVEPPGQPLDVGNIMLQSNPSLWYFASIDIIKRVMTGSPTYFQYEVPFSLELCERMYQLRDIYNTQWLHGFPDQYILLFAWINNLCETRRANDNSQLVAWIEKELPRIKIAVGETSDPMLRIWGMVVQECWRAAVLVYLYMVLCGVDALDPRVIRAQKTFMRVIRGAKPGRNPDSHLLSPFMIVGVATVEERDRDTLRQRILGLRECKEPGNTGNDILQILEEIWARARDEGRAAVWWDLRLAHMRVMQATHLRK